MASVSKEFYLERAAECARDADAATLDNVKDRLRRSEAAWLTIADLIVLREARRSEDARLEDDPDDDEIPDLQDPKDQAGQ